MENTDDAYMNDDEGESPFDECDDADPDQPPLPDSIKQALIAGPMEESRDVVKAYLMPRNTTNTVLVRGPYIDLQFLLNTDLVRAGHAHSFLAIDYDYIRTEGVSEIIETIHRLIDTTNSMSMLHVNYLCFYAQATKTIIHLMERLANSSGTYITPDNGRFVRHEDIRRVAGSGFAALVVYAITKLPLLHEMASFIKCVASVKSFIARVIVVTFAAMIEEGTATHAHFQYYKNACKHPSDIHTMIATSVIPLRIKSPFQETTPAPDVKIPNVYATMALYREAFHRAPKSISH